MISNETALKIARAYREIEVAEKMLSAVSEALQRNEEPDVRDHFGRRSGLTLGIGTLDSCKTLCNVPWTLAKPVIEAHIVHHKSIIAVLSETAKIEAGAVA